MKHLYFYIILYLLSFISIAQANLSFELNAKRTSEFNLEPKSRVEVTLVSEYDHVQRGVGFLVAFSFKLKPGWHIYWKNPGLTGLATKVKWNLPKGVIAGPLLWQAPSRFETGGIESFGYKNEVTLLSQIQITKEYLNDSLNLNAEVNWLACKESCIPENKNVSLNLVVGEKRLENINAKQLIQTNYEILTSIKQINLEESFFKSKTFQLLEKDFVEFEYFPYSRNTSYIKGKSVNDLKKLLNYIPERAFGETLGLLKVKKEGSKKLYEIKYSRQNNRNSILWVLFSAFIGGLLLNFMPCVFPVISLKVMSFVKQAEEGRGKAVVHSIFFCVGITSAFLALALVLIMLKHSGESVGWGFQMQSPSFLLALITLLFLIAMNLFGLFEIGFSLAAKGGAIQVKQGYLGSFMSGMLTTVIATPCTAPFMGTALGFALTQTTFQAVLIFTSLGLGMGLPYILLASSRRLLSLIPAPGTWMVYFKHSMGFLVLVSLIWFLYNLNQVSGSNALFISLLLMWVLAVLSYIYGKWVMLEQNKIKKNIKLFFLTLILSLSLYGSWVQVHQSEPIKQASDQVWEQWSQQREDQLKANGKAYFIDFTADWCLSCKVNENLVLETVEIQNEFKSKKVALLKADWTRRNATITKKLESYQRNGVPLYVLVDKNGQERILPEILSKKKVLEALSEF